MSVIKKININGVAYDINAQNMTDDDVTIPGNKTFSNIPKFPTISGTSDSSTNAANSAFVQAVVQAAAALKLSISALGTNWQTALAEALTNAHVPSSTSALAISASESVSLAQAIDTTPTNGSTKHVTSGGVYNALATKQNNLTFDGAPVNGSGNPVTSRGVYNALYSYSPGYLAGSGNGIPKYHKHINSTSSTYGSLYNDIEESLPEGPDWCMASGKISMPASTTSVYFYVTYIERGSFNSIVIHGNYDTSSSLVPASVEMTNGSSTGCAYNIAY
jgi:hypothetical protein